MAATTQLLPSSGNQVLIPIVIVEHSREFTMSTKPMRPHFAGFLLASALGLAACAGASEVSSSATSTGDNSTPLSQSDTPPLLVHNAPLSSGGDEEEVFGVLVLEGDCLYIDDDGFRLPVVWPNGTNWDPEAETVTLNDGQSVAIGGSILGAGGSAGADAIGGLAGEAGAALAAGCVDNDSRLVAILNNTSEPLVVGPATVSLEGPQTITVDTECGNGVELDGNAGFQLADDSPVPPLAWRGQSVEGVVALIDDSTITFTSGDLELVLTSEAVDAICRPFSDEQ